MKKYYSILILFFGFISFSFTGIEIHKLIPGQGIDNDVIIGKTNRDEVVKKFGNDFTEKLVYGKIVNSKDSFLASHILYYEKTGVKFEISNYQGLSAITIYESFNGKTDKGIKVGISTMQNVVDAYGKQEWKFWKDVMFLSYDKIGIAFYIPFNGIFPVPKSVMENAFKKKINTIVINGKH